MMRDICAREQIAPEQVVLHSDNGAPMKGATMVATLQALGVMPSFSRPAVSNDNPYSEVVQDNEVPPGLSGASVHRSDVRAPVGGFLRPLV